MEGAFLVGSLWNATTAALGGRGAPSATLEAGLGVAVPDSGLGGGVVILDSCLGGGVAGYLVSGWGRTTADGIRGGSGSHPDGEALYLVFRGT